LSFRRSKKKERLDRSKGEASRAKKQIEVGKVTIKEKERARGKGMEVSKCLRPRTKGRWASQLLTIDSRDNEGFCQKRGKRDRRGPGAEVKGSLLHSRGKEKASESQRKIIREEKKCNVQKSRKQQSLLTIRLPRKAPPLEWVGRRRTAEDARPQAEDHWYEYAQRRKDGRGELV